MLSGCSKRWYLSSLEEEQGRAEPVCTLSSWPESHPVSWLTSDKPHPSQSFSFWRVRFYSWFCCWKQELHRRGKARMISRDISISLGKPWGGGCFFFKSMKRHTRLLCLESTNLLLNLCKWKSARLMCLTWKITKTIYKPKRSGVPFPHSPKQVIWGKDDINPKLWTFSIVISQRREHCPCCRLQGFIGNREKSHL